MRLLVDLHVRIGNSVHVRYRTLLNVTPRVCKKRAYFKHVSSGRQRRQPADFQQVSFDSSSSGLPDLRDYIAAATC
jgi:hypothetical protein